MTALPSSAQSRLRTRFLQRSASVLVAIALIGGMTVVNTPIASAAAPTTPLEDFCFVLTTRANDIVGRLSASARVTLIRGDCDEVFREPPSAIAFFANSPKKTVKFRMHHLCEGAPVGMDPGPDTKDFLYFSLSRDGDPVNFNVLKMKTVEFNDETGPVDISLDGSSVELDLLRVGQNRDLCLWDATIQTSLTDFVMVADVAGIYVLDVVLQDFDDVEAYNLKGEWRVEVGQLAQPLTPGPVLSDPTASTVATAVEQSAAAGVEGTSSAVLVRNGEVVPVTSTLSSGVGPRGGVVLEAAGLRAAVASSSGARADVGVIVPLSGELEVSIVSGLVPGAVVEVWVNSSPRLVAAARVPDDHAEGDTLTIAVPLGAPLDGGEPIEGGAHTLQIRMYTDAGFEVLATGITVGGVVPTRVPAGEGPVSPAGLLFVLLGAAGFIGLAVRRTAVSG